MVIVKRRRADWYYGWNILGLVVLSQVCAVGVPMNCFSLFVRVWSSDYEVPISSLALSITVLTLACAALAPLVGWCVDRYPIRRLLVIGLSLTAVFHAGIALTQAAWQIMVLYSLVGPFAVAFSANLPAQTLVSRWFVHRRGFALGLSAAGLALGGIAYPPLVVWLLRNFGWRETWGIFAVIGLLIVPLILMFLRDHPRPEELLDHAPARSPEVLEALTYREVLGRRNFWVVIGATVPIICASSAVVFNLAPILTSYSLSIELAGLMLSTFSVASLSGKLGFGLLVDRWGNRIALVLVGCVSALGVSLLATGSASVVQLTVAFIIIGLSGGAVTLLASAIAAEFGPHGFGRAFGLALVLVPLGSLAAPLLARSQESTGVYTGGLTALAVMAMVAAAIALFFKDRGTTAIEPAAAAVE